MPAASNEVAERCLLGYLWADVKVLRIKPFREGVISSASDRDAAEATNIAFDIFLEVAIVNGMRKSHERSSVGISRVPSK